MGATGKHFFFFCCFIHFFYGYASHYDTEFYHQLENIIYFDPMKYYIEKHFSCKDRLPITGVSKKMFSYFSSWRQALLDRISFWRKKQKQICLFGKHLVTNDEYQRFFLFKTLYQMSRGIPDFEKKLNRVQEKRFLFRNPNQSNNDLLKEAWWKTQKKPGKNLFSKKVVIWHGTDCFMDKSKNQDMRYAAYPINQYMRSDQKKPWIFLIKEDNERTLLFLYIPPDYVVADLSELPCEHCAEKSVSVAIHWHLIEQVVAYYKSRLDVFLEYIFVYALYRDVDESIKKKELIKILERISLQFPRTALLFNHDLFDDIPQSRKIFCTYSDFLFMYQAKKKLLSLPLYEAWEELNNFHKKYLYFPSLTQKRNLYFYFFLYCIGQDYLKSRPYVTCLNQLFLYLIERNFISKKELKRYALSVFLNKSLASSRIFFLLYYFFKDPESFSAWFKTIYDSTISTNEDLTKKRNEYLRLLFSEHTNKDTFLLYKPDQYVDLHNFLFVHHKELFSPVPTLQFLIRQFLSYFFYVTPYSCSRRLSTLINSEDLQILLQAIVNILVQDRDHNQIDYQSVMLDGKLFCFSSYPTDYFIEGGEKLYQFMRENESMYDIFFYLYQQCEIVDRKFECFYFLRYPSAWAVLMALKNTYNLLKQYTCFSKPIRYEV